MTNKKKYIVKIIPDINYPIQHLLKIRLKRSKKRLIKNSPYQIELNFTADGLLGFGSELIRQAILHKKKWIKDKLFYDMDSKKPYFYRGFHLVRNSPELVPLINDKLQFSKEKSTEKNIHNSKVEDTQESYIVELSPSCKKTVEFEKNNKNFAHILIKSEQDNFIYDKLFFHKIEIILTTESMLHLGEVLIRKAIIFNKKIKNPACNTKNEILYPQNIGFILKPENIQLSITINHPESILKKGKLKIKKVIWSKTDYEYYFLEIILTIFSFFSGE